MGYSTAISLVELNIIKTRRGHTGGYKNMTNNKWEQTFNVDTVVPIIAGMDGTNGEAG